MSLYTHTLEHNQGPPYIYTGSWKPPYQGHTLLDAVYIKTSKTNSSQAMGKQLGALKTEQDTSLASCVFCYRDQRQCDSQQCQTVGSDEIKPRQSRQVIVTQMPTR